MSSFTSGLTSMISGIGLLIGIYLFLANGNATVNIINSVSRNAVSGIKVLQGRG